MHHRSFDVSISDRDSLVWILIHGPIETSLENLTQSRFLQAFPSQHVFSRCVSRHLADLSSESFIPIAIPCYGQRDRKESEKERNFTEDLENTVCETSNEKIGIFMVNIHEIIAGDLIVEWPGHPARYIRCCVTEDSTIKATAQVWYSADAAVVRVNLLSDVNEIPRSRAI